ncbi:MAG: iron ABC transporter permease [Cellulosilyticum sp.]|nr:iron ABC transporter permease [Cellulosilyticum sp.]
MESQKRKGYFLMILLTVFLLLCIVISATVGSASLTIWDSLQVILSKVPILNRLMNYEPPRQIYEVIIWQVRMPRILQAAFVGGSLAVVGCTFQAIFKNALADPHILGISSGASLGATIGILSGITLNFFGLGVTSIFAFIGAILTVTLVYRMGTWGSRMNVTNLLLVGTAMSTLLSAMISLLMIFNREQLEKVYLWTLGSFSSATWDKMKFVMIITVVGVVILCFYSRELNALLTGDEVAASLGVDTDRVKKILIIVAALLIAASVSVSGPIGFVGLIMPHCMRLLAGSDHRRLLPLSMLAGASFTIVCDTIARTVADPTEIPVGVITAVFGAPYFIYLLYRHTKGGRG